MAEKKPVSKILRVLLLDDSPDDAEQASMALRAAGYMLKSQRLETGVAVEQNLDSNPWDLILCAHGVANLPARQVVEQAARKQPFTPVIVLARRIQDDEVRTLMQAGARDVLMKGQWGRLTPVVERELAVAEERRRWQETHEALTNLESRYRTMIEASLEAISYVQDGMHMDANPAYMRLFGFEDLETLKEHPLLNLIDKSDQARFKQALKKPEGADKAQEFQAVTAAGARIAIEVAMTPLTIHGEPCLQVVATDITKRKALETKLQNMNQRDPLTGLYNRGHFLEALGASLKAPGGAVIGVTLPRLAEINGQLGHVACDRLLMQIGQQLRELAGSLPAARVTGGQFALLLDAKTAPNTETLADKIRATLAALHAGEGAQALQPEIVVRSLKLDGQIKDRLLVLDEIFNSGAMPFTSAPATVAPRSAAPTPPPVTAPPPAAAPAEAVITPPAQAMVPPPANLPALEPLSGSDYGNALQQALQHNQMQLLFQPIINLHGEPRCFYEAQLVLRTADGQAIGPQQYLASAQSSGLAGKIDRSLLLNVIDTLSKHRMEGRPATVFVSLSPQGVMDSALLAAIQMHMKATGLDPGDLILQVNETALARNFDAARQFIDKARSLGLGIAIDRFTNRGIPIERLAELPIEFFAIQCNAPDFDEDALYGAIDAVTALEKQVIARGIEDGNLFSSLFARGAHYVQGDYLQPGSPALDYTFEAEQTLTSEQPLGPNWRAAG
jgi:PAS domain S-box-containing protein/diguanylate cyclase (GGDEF)-like protein